MLSDIELDVRRGEFLSLLGPSGCGKTTLLKTIADLEDPDRGEIRVEGMTPSAARKKHKYSMVFQSPALLDWRNVLANIELPLELRGIGRKERREIAMAQLRLVDLQGYEYYYPSELSGGMKQRVGIARALASDPDILLMDEPFSALDQFTKDRLHDDLLRIWEDTGKTILFVTHDISEAVFLSDRICIFSANPARLVKTEEVHLPRPREAAVLKTRDYFDIVSSIRDEFEGSGSYDRI